LRPNVTHRDARRRHLARLLLLDLLAMALAFAGAYALRVRLELGILYLPLGVYLPVAALLTLLLVALFFRFRLYTDLPYGSAAAEAFGVAWAVTVAMALITAGAFWLRALTLSRLLVGLTYLLLILLVVAGRLGARALRRAELQRGVGVRRVYLAGRAAIPEVAGLYADEFRRGSTMAVEAPTPDWAQLPAVLQSGEFDEVVIDGAEVQPVDLIFAWGSLATRHGVALKVIPPGATLSALPVAFDPTAGLPLLEVGRGLLDPVAQLGKRALDLVLLVLLAVPGLLLIGVVTVLILVKSPGASPFFWHTRLGRGGRLIRILKFRTMVPNAEKLLEDDPELRRRFEEEYKLKDDPRQTGIGRFLRRTSLDELPQLWNILIGEMSFVGPRPIVPPELEKYGRYGDLLLAVAPGLTGLWQVSGRSNVSYAERIQLDMLYIARWSLLLDLKILWLTIPAVLARRGAG
ncbi:MAG TPA: exopolysaccharide biosynthesis polyprenyl glycosylphosphotransferase, partial [bacterium]|nr:exopolysaccharide biosynthesis polyprenyl glycosylphosphotransferase [bacterium]